MPTGAIPWFCSPDSHRQVDVLEVRGTRRGSLVSRLEHWEWLHQLRNRFELAIEVLDFDLQHVLSAVTHVQSAVALRRALQTDGEGMLRDVAAATLRSGRPRSLTACGLRIRLFPLFSRMTGAPRPVGVLLLADIEALADCSGQTTADIDRRLDATGEWLVAAVEAAIAASAHDADQARTTERLTGIVDVIDALSRSESEREIVGLVMEALALWYDADVRVYRQHFSGTFLLEAALPGIDTDTVALRLGGDFIKGRHDVFQLESMSDVNAIGWVGPAEALFVPLIVDDSTEWLLTVSGAVDASFTATLGVLSRAVSVRLTHLLRESAERLLARVRAVLTFGDAPFDATTRLALELIARDTGALSAQIATYYDAQRTPAVVIGWACPDDHVPLFTAAGTTHTTPRAMTAGVAAGSGITAVLALGAEGPGFSAGVARLAQSAAELLGVWLSGAMVQSGDVRVVAESEYSTEFVGRLAGHVDRFGRLKPGGAVAVVVPHAADDSGVQLDEVIQVVQDQVRSSDVVGIVGCGAGVFIPEATRAAASGLVDRLIRAARQPGRVPVRVGITTFPPLSESPETLVRRALINAQREAWAS